MFYREFKSKIYWVLSIDTKLKSLVIISPFQFRLRRGVERFTYDLANQLAKGYKFNIIVYAILLLLIVNVSFKFLWVFGIFVLGIIIPALAVTFRRLHDINKSGWYFFLPFPFELIERVLERSSGDIAGFSIIFSFISLGLYIYLLVLYCTHGDKKNNRFGKNIYKRKRNR